MLMNVRKKIQNQKGFTLVELLVVIAIIGILAAVAIPRMSGATQAARDGRLTSDLATVDSALSMYYAKNLAYPADIDTLTKNPDKFLNSEPKDAAGGALSYTVTAASGGTPASYSLSGKKSDGTTTVTSNGSGN